MAAITLAGRTDTETRATGALTTLITLAGRTETETRATAAFVGVTGVTVHPTTATIDIDELLIVTETVLPTNAFNKDVTWSSSNTAIATVSGGIVTGIAEGSANIIATTVDGSFTASCAITVEKFEYESYVALKVLNKDLVTIEHTIDNTEIVELTIEKELGGNHGLNFTLPYTSTAVAEIIAGRYIECEGQKYFLERITTERGSDGNPFLRVVATHIFFEIEHLQAGTAVGRYGTILSLLQELLSQFGITVAGMTAGHELYDVTRYVTYEADESILDCVKRIFEPFFASYRLDNLQIVVIPEVGESDENHFFLQPCFAARSFPTIKFRYGVNNQSITKDTDYSDIITKLYAEGDDITYTANAPAAIKALYRQERERTVSFSGVSVQADLEYLADRYLGHKQLPLTSYTLSVAELKHISDIATIYPNANFDIQIGQRVKIIDSEFNLTVESVIQRYTYRPLEKEALSTVVIGDLKPYDITFSEPNRTGRIKTPSTVSPSMNEWWNLFGDDPSDTTTCTGLMGIISTEEPDEEGNYNENCLWFKY